MLRVTYDTSTAKMDRVQASLTAAQADIAACLAGAESDHRKGLPDALRRCNACAYLTRVLQHTADKVSPAHPTAYLSLARLPHLLVVLFE